MQIVALLEIVPDSSGALPTALLGAAYRASRTGYVMLALRGISPQAVDRVLDPLVSASRSWRLNGVVYVNAADERFVCGVAQRARVVMATSRELRGAFADRGIACDDVDAVMSRLADLERGPGVVVPSSMPATAMMPQRVPG